MDRRCERSWNACGLGMPSSRAKRVASLWSADAAASKVVVIALVNSAIALRSSTASPANLIRTGNWSHQISYS